MINQEYLQDKEIICVGFSPWKRPTIKLFLNENNITFVKEFSQKLLKRNSLVILWASNKTLPQENTLIKENIPYLYCEDGFIRSSGLGIKLFLPGSLSFSRKSIHFDSTKSTELEGLLNETILEKNDIERIKNIIQFIKNKNISKYGKIGDDHFPKKTNSNKNILIIGQVENDASLEYGSPLMKSNRELLQRVIDNNDECNLYYKPHPDVVSKLRLGEVSPDFLKREGIIELRNCSLSNAIKNCDEVHVLSSQSGIDALIMNKKVVCHGSPFYSGWGLTHDTIKIERRTRTLSLEELLFISFIKYPTYLNLNTKKICEIEDILNLMTDNDFQWPHAPHWMQFLVKFKREYLRLKNGYLRKIR